MWIYKKWAVEHNLTQVTSYLRVDALHEEKGVIPLNDNHRLRRWLCFFGEKTYLYVVYVIEHERSCSNVDFY